MKCEEIIGIIFVVTACLIVIIGLCYFCNYLFNTPNDDEKNKNYYKAALDRALDERDYYKHRFESVKIYNDWLNNQLEQKRK